MVEIIAEFTTNHCGHLGMLLRMVDAAAKAGASWIKMQRKNVEGFYTREKLDAPFDSPFGKTYRDYRTMFELDGPDWDRFDERCHRRGIPWFCTIQDIESFNMPTNYGLTRHKVSSSNARNMTFAKALAHKTPDTDEFIVSVGGCTLEEVDFVVNVFRDKAKLWLLHCVAEYPTPPEHARLGNIPELKKRFASDNVRIGYSGHEIGIDATCVAVSLGAEMVERHFCLSRQSFVHHIECSLEPDEFENMVFIIRQWELTPPTIITRKLPQEAYKSEFGMSDAESRFLVDQTYGNDFLGVKSCLK